MIKQKDVQHVAGLARISLDESEAKGLTTDLEKIIDYIDKLETLDISNVKPTSHALPLHNVFREDKIRPSLKQEDALGISIAQRKGSFQVPKVIE